MDWTANWIWAKEHTQTPNFYMYARREFETELIGGARCLVTCSTEYKLYINGRYIGRGPSPCHPSYQYYDEYDVNHALRPGKNVIAALCYNYGVGTHCRPQAPGAFLLQLEIGGEPCVITDESWKVTPATDWDFNSAQMFWTIGFQEVYDSRKRPVGWHVVGFDDSGWQEPQVLGEVGIEPWNRLVPREIPHLREIEARPEKVHRSGVVFGLEEDGPDIATRMYSEKTSDRPGIIRYCANMLTASTDAAEVQPGEDVFVVLDFGREVVGFPKITIQDGGQAVVDIGYSEALDAAGEVHPTRQGILQADRVILHGGRQEWQSFGRRAFRYMQLTFRDVAQPLYIRSVSIDTIGYPAEQVSTFECSDQLLNDIWRTGVYTLGLCMQDQYEDCPLREHGQYPGDVRVEALMNYYCFFDTRLVAKALQQFVQCRRDDGFFNALWPSSTNHALPDYNLVWVMILYDYHLYTGDLALVERLFPDLRLLLENWIRTQESQRGLLTYQPGQGNMLQEWWLFIDHAPLDKHGEVAAYNAFYYRALRDAAKLAAATGNHEDSAAWHARARHIFQAFNDLFWNEELGAYADCYDCDKLSDTISVQTNMLAVLFGLADSERTRLAMDYIRSGRPCVQSSGPYFNFYVLQAMAKMGEDREALDLIRRDWGGMLERGATTWWETFSADWDADTICPDSLCHAWSGAPTYFLPAEVLGVKPSTPTSDVVIVQPRYGDLDWARGRIKTRAGYVDVQWSRVNGVFTIDINAPCGFIAALPVSGFDNPVVEEIDLSPETPVRRARKTYGWGNVVWRDWEEHDPYIDWLASQESAPPDDYRPPRRIYLEDRHIWVREAPGANMRYIVKDDSRQGN